MKEGIKDVIAIALTLIIGFIIYKLVGVFFKALWITIIIFVSYFIVRNFIIKD